MRSRITENGHSFTTVRNGNKQMWQKIATWPMCGGSPASFGDPRRSRASKRRGTCSTPLKVPLVALFVRLKPRAYVTTYKYAAPAAAAHPPTHSAIRSCRLRPPLLQTVPHLSFGRDDLVGLPRAGQAARAADAGRVSRTATLARNGRSSSSDFCPARSRRRPWSRQEEGQEDERVRDFESEAGSPLRCSDFLAFTLMFYCI